jgi:hypothetical protein
VSDILIASLRLTRDTDVVLEKLLPERTLKRQTSRVTLKTGREAPVIPDCFLVLRPPGGLPVAIAFELDRGTEDQKRWRGKIDALASWAAGPYQTDFAIDNLTIAVVAPTPTRADQLASWASAELSQGRYPSLSEIFLLTSVSPTSLSPENWFVDAIWLHLPSKRIISLLDRHEGELVYRPAPRIVGPETAILPDELRSTYPARRTDL